MANKDIGLHCVCLLRLFVPKRVKCAFSRSRSLSTRRLSVTSANRMIDARRWWWPQRLAHSRINSRPCKWAEWSSAVFQRVSSLSVGSNRHRPNPRHLRSRHWLRNAQITYKRRARERKRGEREGERLERLLSSAICEMQRRTSSIHDDALVISRAFVVSPCSRRAYIELSNWFKYSVSCAVSNTKTMCLHLHCTSMHICPFLSVSLTHRTVSSVHLPTTF